MYASKSTSIISTTTTLRPTTTAPLVEAQAERDEARAAFVGLFDQASALLGVDDLPLSDVDAGISDTAEEPDGSIADTPTGDAAVPADASR